jgi:RNA polymerase sigma-70 factor (ECF subfamily)
METPREVDPIVPAAPREVPDLAAVRRALVDSFPAMWRLLRRMGVPASSLDDAVQEVFLTAVRRASAIRPGSERSFLYGVALRVAARARGRDARAPSDDPPEVPDPGPLPDALLEQHRAREALDRILDRMSDDLRVTFVLYELDEVTLPEIAELTEVPLGTATSRLRRAREFFRAEVDRTQRRAKAEGRQP